MSSDCAHIVNAVAAALENDVLPLLDPATPAAGNIRASLMMLAYVEDRLRAEHAAFGAANARLRELMDAIAADGELARADASIVATARAALTDATAAASAADADAPARTHAVFNSAATRMIKAAHANRAAHPPAVHARLRERLRACAEAAAAPETTFTARAATLLPI